MNRGEVLGVIFWLLMILLGCAAYAVMLKWLVEV